MFTQQFDAETYAGETITCEVDGFTLTATIHADDDCLAPWKRYDGHGPVTGWERRSKAAGELVLNSDRDGHRFYDFAEACRIARRDGWGVKGGQLEGETARAYAARAARADYDRLRAWCNDEWCYVGVIIELRRNGVTVSDDSCWGIETFKDYHLEWTAEQLTYMVNADRKERAESAIAKRKENKERIFWACRDVVTA